jgi:rhamnogalacturonan endolyase
MRSRLSKRSLLAVFLALVCAVSSTVVADSSGDGTVAISSDADTATIANGILSATIDKATGNLRSLQFHGVDVLAHGEEYMNVYGETPGETKTQEKPGPSELVITQNPQANGGSIGEIAIRFPYHGQPNAVPMDLEIRFTLHRGDSGLYAWEIITHDPKSPPFNIEAGTFCLKLDPHVFDFFTVDSARQRQMITGTDWMKGQPLNLKEARRMTTGVHQGEVEHKYDYATVLAQTPAYGWSSTTKDLGVWVVNPSSEYIVGSPTKVDLTGHIDLKDTPSANPTLLFVWHSNHYGGHDVQVKAGESWKKIIGPVLYYCNAGSTPQAMYHDALSRATVDQKDWPYAWADAPGYPHAQDRGGVTGQLVVHDPQDARARAAGAWVGLAQPPYADDFGKGPVKIEWQEDGKNYQYWTHADATGQFSIATARPGKYTLYAFTNGVLGDFSRADIDVERGKIINLGQILWTPVRYGQQIWEIGTPDRSADEFRHGDQPWQWGLYNLYPKEFPGDVDFVIGKSDWQHDWNYVEPPRPDGKGGYSNTTWRIRFNMRDQPAGTATLRVAICGVRGGPVDISVNGHAAGSTGPLPDAGAMHRDAMRSIETLRDISFDASLLKPGENVIELTKHARAWTDGVMYDYLRLEIDPQRSFTQ